VLALPVGGEAKTLSGLTASSALGMLSVAFWGAATWIASRYGLQRIARRYL